MNTIALTGASGFIGSALTRHFIAASKHVVALTRKPLAPQENFSWRRFNLEDREHSPELLAGADVLIHAAVDLKTSGDAFEMNVRGTQGLLDIARANGVRRCMFLSSFSAHHEAQSSYGRHKNAIEQLFHEPGAAIVRPGLVIGKGGLFARLVEHLRLRRIVPLIDGGVQPLQTIYIDDLIVGIECVLRNELSGIFDLAEPEPISYAAFQLEICARLKASPLFVPIPFALAQVAIHMGKALGVQLPITIDNLLGLKALRSRRTIDDINRLGISVRNVRESLDALFLTRHQRA